MAVIKQPVFILVFSSYVLKSVSLCMLMAASSNHGNSI